MKTDCWYTPPEISQSLGVFDLDPCSPKNPPYMIAKKIFTEEDNGLLLPWFGRVWLNPPYGREVKYWIEKMAEHRNGIALLFARTDTEAFHRFIFPVCHSILFIEGRINFLNSAGIRAKTDGKAPSLLIGYGEQNVEAIERSTIKGKHVLFNHCPVIIVGVSPAWKEVVKISLGRLNGEGCLQQIYEAVELLAPDKVKKNEHFKAKVRQVLQTYFVRVDRGKWKKPVRNEQEGQG